MLAHNRSNVFSLLVFLLLLSFSQTEVEARQHGTRYCAAFSLPTLKTPSLTTPQSIACQLARLEKGESRGIDLSHRTVTEPEMDCLVHRLQLLLPTTPPSLSLFLTSSEINSEAARRLAYSLPHLSSLVGLVLAKAEVAPDGITALMKALPSCKHLQYLNLAALPLLQRDVCLITNCANLKTLDLKGCGVTDTGVEKLANSLPALSDLYFLDLSENPIGDAGAAALVEAIASLKQTSLRMLHLVNTSGISLPLKKELVAACNAKAITLFLGGEDVRDPLIQQQLLNAAIYWKGRCTPANVRIAPVLFIL